MVHFMEGGEGRGWLMTACQTWWQRRLPPTGAAVVVTGSGKLQKMQTFWYPSVLLRTTQERRPLDMHCSMLIQCNEIRCSWRWSLTSTLPLSHNAGPR
jgi:hypothetical protein